MNPIRIAIADPRPEYRLFLRSVLESEPDVTVVGEAGDGIAVVETVDEHKPDLMLIEVRLPGMDGIAAIRLITAKHPQTRVIVLSHFTDDGTRAKALEAGAVHCLSKDAHVAGMLAVIRGCAPSPTADPEPPPAGAAAQAAGARVVADSQAPPLTGTPRAHGRVSPGRTTRTQRRRPAVRAAAPTARRRQQDEDTAVFRIDPLQRYMAEIGTYRLLTREEERDYAVRVREHGDQEAAYVLVTSNLRLVVKLALEFQRVWMQNLLDLIQEGNIGLLQAVKRFDPYKNVKFSYYASFWIKAYILKFIMDNWRLVKIGTTQGQRKLFFKLKKEKQRLVELGFTPQPKVLSERLGVSEREIVDMDQRLDGWDVSLDAPIREDSDTHRIQFLSDEEDSAETHVSRKEVELLLHSKIADFRTLLNSREALIFDQRLMCEEPVTLQDIGDRYGISRERIRQLEKRIIRKMRDFLRHEIPDFASFVQNNASK